ncbi:tyrosine-protein phosphatase [Streptomyces sp. RKAG337]|uniref:tyrosine-protein phosphatase n=1 Tax=Streptomyces sp. RKAG337 TaxID=2893404 RepID=UPI0035A915BF
MTQQLPQTPATDTEAGTGTTPGAEPVLTGVRNFRDVGGLRAADGRRVRPGKLFRSGHLAHTTDEDAAFLATLGLHTVFDFRNADDIRMEGPDVDLPGVRNVNMPLSDPAHGADFWHTVRDGDLDALRDALGDGKGAERMTTAYRQLILDRTAQHSRMLELLAEEPAVPALLHCAAGKDRAGTSMAIILLALGVERADIEADYLESNAAHRRYKVQRGDGATGSAIDPEIMKLLSPLFEARLEYLTAAFDTIDERWGSVDHYLSEGLGCTEERRARLRELLLTDA